MGIAANEAISNTDYPKVARDWEITMRISNEIRWSPMGSQSSNKFVQIIQTVSKDHQGKEHFKNNVTNSYKLSDIPEGLAEKVISVGSKSARVMFK